MEARVEGDKPVKLSLIKKSIKVVRAQYRQLALALIKSEIDMEDIDRLMYILDDDRINNVEIDRIYNSAFNTLAASNKLLLELKELKREAEEAHIKWQKLHYGGEEKKEPVELSDIDFKILFET